MRVKEERGGWFIEADSSDERKRLEWLIESLTTRANFHLIVLLANAMNTRAVLPTPSVDDARLAEKIRQVVIDWLIEMNDGAVAIQMAMSPTLVDRIADALASQQSQEGKSERKLHKLPKEYLCIDPKGALDEIHLRLCHRCREAAEVWQSLQGV